MLCGITTSPRPDGISYLRRTCESLIAAGGNNPTIFAEPDSPFDDIMDLKVTWIQRKERFGNWRNWREMARHMIALADGMDEEYLLLSEDDVIYSENAIQKATDYLNTLAAAQEPVGCLLVYTSSMYQRGNEQGVFPLNTRSLWGACAMAWPKRSLQAVIECHRAQRWRGADVSNLPNPGSPDIAHADTAISCCLDDVNLKLWALNPGLAQHIGARSSIRDNIGLTDERQSRNVL